MSLQIQAAIILLTFIIALGLYALNKQSNKIRFLKTPIVVHVEPYAIRPSGSLFSRAGVIIVFVVNITTAGVVFACAYSARIERTVHVLRFDLPLWVNITGAVFFVLYSLWGLLVLFFNPNYTPLYKSLRGEYIIATEGPYGVVRHPRYAAAALANIIYFLFTGCWLPLLGILGWPALYFQARAEEKCLVTLAPKAYGDYCWRTGMFFPKISLSGKSK